MSNFIIGVSYGSYIQSPENIFDVKKWANAKLIEIPVSDYAVSVMDLTDGDKKKGLPEPEAWADVKKVLSSHYPNLQLGKIERFDFYEQAKKAYAVIATGEERIYGNFILVKGCVL